MNKPLVRKIGKDHFEINVTGNKDYRSPDIDIDIIIKINEFGRDEIEVMIPKSQRCYGYTRTIEEPGFTKLIFN